MRCCPATRTPPGLQPSAAEGSYPRTPQTTATVQDMRFSQGIEAWLHTNCPTLPILCHSRRQTIGWNWSCENGDFSWCCNQGCSLQLLFLPSREIASKGSQRLRAWRVAPKLSGYSFVPFTDSQSKSCAAPSRTLARRRSRRSFCCGETSNRSKRSRKSSQMASMIWIFWPIGIALTSSAVMEQRYRSPGGPASFISASNAAPQQAAGSIARA